MTGSRENTLHVSNRRKVGRGSDVAGKVLKLEGVGEEKGEES